MGSTGLGRDGATRVALVGVTTALAVTCDWAGAAVSPLAAGASADFLPQPMQADVIAAANISWVQRTRCISKASLHNDGQ